MSANQDWLFSVDDQKLCSKCHVKWLLLNYIEALENKRGFAPFCFLLCSTVCFMWALSEKWISSKILILHKYNCMLHKVRKWGAMLNKFTFLLSYLNHFFSTPESTIANIYLCRSKSFFYWSSESRYSASVRPCKHKQHHAQSDGLHICKRCMFVHSVHNKMSSSATGLLEKLYWTIKPFSISNEQNALNTQAMFAHNQPEYYHTGTLRKKKKKKFKISRSWLLEPLKGNFFCNIY